MASVTDAGVIVYPPVPAFYERPQTLEQMIDHTLGRILDLLDIDVGAVERWSGTRSARRFCTYRPPDRVTTSAFGT